jgi:hypothetical protein
MRKRKLQIFLSSTYEDLIDERLAAMEAILAAGHIPAAMEQFSPGDDTAIERIRAWIDESDCFVLILAGRYGSIERTSGKSYVQLEYEYARERNKPFFALVVSGEHHDERVRKLGLKVDEREHPDKYKIFRAVVAEKLCKFWDDQKDIKNAILHKLPEWSQRRDLIGWVQGNEAADPNVANEIARLSRENNELRAAAVNSAERYTGLSFSELSQMLIKIPITEEQQKELVRSFGPEFKTPPKGIHDVLTLFLFVPGFLEDAIIEIDELTTLHFLTGLSDLGLLVCDGEQRRTSAIRKGFYKFALSEPGRRFRNRWLANKMGESDAEKPTSGERQT